MTGTSTPVRRALRPSGRLLPEDTRRHHRALLLQLLFRYGPASRADLARSSGLTRVTVSDVVGGLVAEGLISESATPVQPDYESFTWQVLSTLATNAEADSSEGRFSVRLSMEPGEPGFGP